MDFSIIRKKLEGGGYRNAAEFAADVRLMFKNCHKYDGDNSSVTADAQVLQQIFEINFTEMLLRCGNGVLSVHSPCIESQLIAACKDHIQIRAELGIIDVYIERLRAEIQVIAKEMNIPSTISESKSIIDLHDKRETETRINSGFMEIEGLVGRLKEIQRKSRQLHYCLNSIVKEVRGAQTWGLEP